MYTREERCGDTTEKRRGIKSIGIVVLVVEKAVKEVHRPDAMRASQIRVIKEDGGDKGAASMMGEEG